MRAHMAIVAGLVTIGSTFVAMPAAAAPPAPVSDVHVTSEIIRDGDVMATISWTQQDPNATGARACAARGVHASRDAGACAVIGDTAGTVAQLILERAQTYSFSVFAFTGDDAQQREYSSPVTTEAFHGSTVVIRNNCNVPTYGEPCRYQALLNDAHSYQRIPGQRVVLNEGDTTAHPTWHEYGADRTNANGSAYVSVTLRRPHSLQWRFAGMEGVLASASDRETVKPQFKVSGHITSSIARLGQKVKIFGAVHPAVEQARAILYVEGRCGFVGSGERTAVKKRRLPNGQTVYGYVLTTSRDAPGKYTFIVLVDGDRDFSTGASPELTLTVGSAATRGSTRSASTC